MNRKLVCFLVLVIFAGFGLTFDRIEPARSLAPDEQKPVTGIMLLCAGILVLAAGIGGLGFAYVRMRRR